MLPQSELHTLRSHPYIADIIDSRWTVRNTSESRILQWHFSIVPGVLSEEIARILVWIESTSSLDTQFLKALEPGDAIGFMGWRENSKIFGGDTKQILASSNSDKADFPVFEKNDHLVQELTGEILDAHLLQSWDFRLASGANPMTQEWYFCGYFTVPEDYQFLYEGRLPFPFMKEIANQVIALSSSLRDNPNGVQKGSTILLARSFVKKDQKVEAWKLSIKGGETLTVVGKAWIDKENEKRWVVASYTAYTWENPLFHGEIKWTKVPTKMLFR